MKKNNKISVITLGCSKNTVDSERLMNQIKLNNLILTDNPEDAGTVIINTCGFIEAAKEESINTILNAIALKKEGKLNKVIVAGCLSERYEEELKREIGDVDAFFGTEKYEGILHELGGELKYELLGERVITTPSHTAYLKISEGCDHPCSFCAIPIMRGGHKSIPIDKLIEEAGFLTRNGAKEIIIIAQDTTDYGRDLYGVPSLAQLLSKLSNVPGVEWLRLMYAYPSNFQDEVIEEIASNPKICKYIDIPLQHISDSVLKSMRRGVTSKRTKELLIKLRERIPGITIRTTFIAGYPNEKQSDFEELCEFIKQIRFDRIGVFTYSVEENTSSFILGDPIPEKEKQRRKDILMEIQKGISLDINKTFVGSKIRVLVESKEGEFYIARSYRDAPEVDGEILIPIDEREITLGKFYTVEIFDYNDYDIYGRFSD